MTVIFCDTDQYFNTSFLDAAVYVQLYLYSCVNFTAPNKTDLLTGYENDIL